MKEVEGGYSAVVLHTVWDQVEVARVLGGGQEVRCVTGGSGQTL